jgi:hypothetical protein
MEIRWVGSSLEKGEEAEIVNTKGTLIRRRKTMPAEESRWSEIERCQKWKETSV